MTTSSTAGGIGEGVESESVSGAAGKARAGGNGESRVNGSGSGSGMVSGPRGSSGVGGFRDLLRGLAALAVPLAVFAGVYQGTKLARRASEEALAERTERRAAEAPAVNVARARTPAPETTVTLPGDVRASAETEIHARTTGYVRRWLADIGDHVKEGQVLAEIDSPEVDQEARRAAADSERARARLTLAEARRELARVNLQRAGDLVRRNSAPAQELDDARAAFKVGDAEVEVARAEIAASEAEARRVEELRGFQKVLAPFDGVVTARMVEAGALVGASGGEPLFRLARTDVLRVFVNVPQALAGLIEPGHEARVLAPESSGGEVVGRVARTAGAIDPRSRTLLTEILVDGEGSGLLAGMYARVRFVLPRHEPPPLIPATALVVNADGVGVLVVGEGNRLEFRRLKPGRDFGAEIEILEGIAPGETMVDNPGEGLGEGSVVRVVERGKD